MASRHEARSSETRATLLGIARDLFATQGYAATSIEQVLERAGMSKGALYYQFKDKRALFEAVFQQLQLELASFIYDETMKISSDIEELGVGCNLMLDACMRPDVRQIMLLDGPAVLGWEALHGPEGQSFQLIAHALYHYVEAGLLEEAAVAPMSHLLLGALMEAGQAIAHADDPQAARDEYNHYLQMLLGFIRQSGSQKG